jgi:hypothetical protein
MEEIDKGRRMNKKDHLTKEQALSHSVFVKEEVNTIIKASPSYELQIISYGRVCRVILSLISYISLYNTVTKVYILDYNTHLYQISEWKLNMFH